MLKQLIDIQCYNMKTKKLKRVPQYAFGADAISNWGNMSGVDKANVVTQGVGAVGSMIGNATSGKKPTAAGVIGGIGSGAAMGASIGGPWGAVIGGAIGGITSSIGSGGSVNEQTGEYELPSGIAGLFGHSKSYIRNKAGRIKNGIQARQMSEQVAADYYQENGYNELSLSKGGVVPSTMAYLDDGEMLRTPDGTIGSIPEEGKPTDSNLLNVPVGTQVLSDKLKVPGTNKTFAEMGKKLMKKSNKKANNIYAENSQMLNERNNQMTYQNLLEQQESIKNKKTNKKQSIPTYEEGTSGVSGRKKVKLKYIYDPMLGDFSYIDPNTGGFVEMNDVRNDLLPDSMWIQNYEAVPVNKNDPYFIGNMYMNGNWGDLTVGKRLSSINPEFNTPALGVIGTNTSDSYLIPTITQDTAIPQTAVRSTPSTKRSTVQTSVQQPVQEQVTGPIQPFSNDRPSLTELTFKPSKVLPKLNIGRPFVYNPSPDDAVSNGLDMSSLYSTVATLAPLFDRERAEKVDAYTYNPVYGPTNYNIDPILREATLSDRIARYNMANINPNTGANMAFGLQSAVNRNKTIANAYFTKNNAENQMAFNNAQIANQWGQQYADARHIAATEYAQNKANARNINRRNFASALNNWGASLRDKKQTSMDMAALEMLQPMLNYGTEDNVLNRVNKILNRVKNG